MSDEEEIMRFQRAVLSEYANSRSGRLSRVRGSREDKKVLKIGVFGSYVKLPNHFTYCETINSKILGLFLM